MSLVRAVLHGLAVRDQVVLLRLGMPIAEPGLARVGVGLRERLEFLARSSHVRPVRLAGMHGSEGG